MIYSLVYFNRLHNKANNIQPVIKSQDLSLNKDKPADHKISGTPGQKTNNKTSEKSASSLNPASGVASTVPVTTVKTKADRQTGPVSAQKTLPDNDVNRNILLSGIQADVASQSASAQSKKMTTAESFPEPVEKSVFISAEGRNENPSVYGMPFPPLVLSNVDLNAETKGTVAKTDTKKAGSQKGIYAVVLGGPDWSAVKMQSSEQAGYSLGILLGYHFNKRISVETGLLWDKKNYYSSGEYFDKSKTSIPYNVNIKNLDGTCNMFEIPINLQYSFASRKNHNFFVEVGLSSYLMKKENYNYEAVKNTWANGSPVDSAYAAYKTYKNTTNNIFAIIQVSGGYEYSIGKNTTIRIEPYVKIPLQGVGIGSMPISSMGLYFGISHLFH